MLNIAINISESVKAAIHIEVALTFISLHLELHRLSNIGIAT